MFILVLFAYLTSSSSSNVLMLLFMERQINEYIEDLPGPVNKSNKKIMK